MWNMTDAAFEHLVPSDKVQLEINVIMASKVHGLRTSVLKEIADILKDNGFKLRVNQDGLNVKIQARRKKNPNPSPFSDW